MAGYKALMSMALNGKHELLPLLLRGGHLRTARTALLESVAERVTAAAAPPPSHRRARAAAARVAAARAAAATSPPRHCRRTTAAAARSPPLRACQAA